MEIQSSKLICRSIVNVSYCLGKVKNLPRVGQIDSFLGYEKEVSWARWPIGDTHNTNILNTQTHKQMQNTQHTFWKHTHTFMKTHDTNFENTHTYLKHTQIQNTQHAFWKHTLL